jgi:hypothetical protein
MMKFILRLENMLGKQSVADKSTKSEAMKRTRALANDRHHESLTSLMRAITALSGETRDFSQKDGELDSFTSQPTTMIVCQRRAVACHCEFTSD